MLIISHSLLQTANGENGLTLVMKPMSFWECDMEVAKSLLMEQLPSNNGSYKTQTKVSTMLIGVDSWEEPTQRAINALKKIDGFSFWNGYVESPGVYDGKAWSATAWELLKSNDVSTVPIYVPVQTLAQNPEDVALDAMAAVKALGLTGAVAIDGEKSMSNILNYQSWLDEVFITIRKAGWEPVNYAGTGYVTSMATNWLVKWGEHEDLPVAGEMIQYGPYTLSDTDGPIMAVDGDSANDIVFATYPTATTGGTTVVSTEEPTPNETPDSETQKDATDKIVLHSPIIASAMLPDKSGAIMVGADGGVFTRGKATFHGSIPANYPTAKLGAPIVAVEYVNDEGYTLVGGDGGRFVFGNDPDFGAL
jgi:hypothetical protein